MPTVKPIYTNPTGGYQQPVIAYVDTLTARGFYAQGAGPVDTNCGVTRPATAQLALLAGGVPACTLTASGATPTLAAAGVDGSGNSVVVAGGQLATSTGLLFPDLTSQTVTARTASRTTNVTNSTITPVTTGLSFSVAAGTIYTFEFYGVYGRTSGSTAALRFSFSAPALGASQWSAPRNNNVNGTSGSFAFNQGTFSTTFTMGPNASATAATVFAAYITGYFVPLASGTFDMRFSPSVGGETMTVYPGTYLSVRVANT